MSGLGKANSHRTILICALLAAVTLAVYWPVSRFDFTNYDDPDYASANRVVQKGLTWDGFKWAFANSFAWHPLTWLSHMLDCQLFGVNPGAHHLVNVAFHTANTVLLFLVLLRLTRAEWPSAFVAGLFALHPLHVESVAWIAERKDVLSAFFWLLTLWAYARYAAQLGVGHYLFVIACFALGLMAKPMVVTLPFVLLLLDYWPLGRLEVPWLATTTSGTFLIPRHASRFKPGHLLLEKIPLFALSAATCTLTILFLKGWGKLDMEIYPFTARLANALVSCVRYLGKTIAPEDLAVIYPHPGAWPLWAVAGATALLILTTLGIVLTARRFPYLVVGWLWFLGTLVPVIGLVQVNPQAMADRYTYLPLIGLFIMVAWGADALTARWAYRRPLLAGAGALTMAACALASLQQLRHWQNSTTLFRHAIAVTTNNPLACYNLAQSLSTRAQALGNRGWATQAQALFEESIQYYRETLRLRPTHHEAHNNLGLTLALLGRPAEATNHYAEALRLNPKNDAASFNYGLALSALGQVDAAIARYRAALELAPDHAPAHYWLGRAFETQGQTAAAILQYELALSNKADYAEAYLGLGALLLAQGRFEESSRAFLEAVRLVPGAADARGKLGMALGAASRHKEAIFHYREALRLKPDQADVLNNLAWILATHPQAEFRDGVEAVRLAERACALTGQKQPVLLGTLGAAYAEAGQFGKAIEAARQARDLAESLGQKELAARNEELLQRYGQGKPWREEGGRAGGDAAKEGE
jgi:tetratricopeptide (TPR) repeat protein